MAKSNHSCAACLQLQRRVEEEAQIEPKTLKCFAGNKTRTAAVLGISLKTLYNRLNEYRAIE